MTRPHLLHVTIDDGSFGAFVECPDEAMGIKRPCAVWADADGSKREDACTFQQYAEDTELEDWLHGRFTFGPVPIHEAGSGDDWHVEIRP